ncbi:MAG: hypothetical protein LBT53_03000 [Puniceicoccales bacterium]|nr:hypothetical protein [Puniceicoccales bacterium]
MPTLAATPTSPAPTQETRWEREHPCPPWGGSFQLPCKRGLQPARPSTGPISPSTRPRSRKSLLLSETSARSRRPMECGDSSPLYASRLVGGAGAKRLSLGTQASGRHGATAPLAAHHAARWASAQRHTNDTARSQPSPHTQRHAGSAASLTRPPLGSQVSDLRPLPPPIALKPLSQFPAAERNPLVRRNGALQVSGYLSAPPLTTAQP